MAVAVLDATPTARIAAHIPVLLAIESAVADGDAVDVDEGGVQVPAVPNSKIFERLETWFGVSGQPDAPYFSPVRMPGGRSLHWRPRGIVAQNTMTAAKNHGWAAAAVPLGDGERGYPLTGLDEWRGEVAQSVGDDAEHPHGIDLAALGVWIARASGVEAEGETPTREELVAGALAGLGLDQQSPLVQDDPGLLSTQGAYVPEPAHFQSAPVGDSAISEVALALDGGPGSEAEAEEAETASEEDWLRQRLREWREPPVTPPNLTSTRS